jgi:hypothetical protein
MMLAKGTSACNNVCILDRMLRAHTYQYSLHLPSHINNSTIHSHDTISLIAQNLIKTINNKWCGCTNCTQIKHITDIFIFIIRQGQQFSGYLFAQNTKMRNQLIALHYEWAIIIAQM